MKASCSRAVYVWDSIAVNPSGKRSIVYQARNGIPGTGRFQRCGKCTACRMRETGDWSTRLFHECLMQERACVGTMTFNDENCPETIEACRVIVKAFKMRLRRAGVGTRMHILCEYGGQFDRPHMHCVFLGEDFRDWPVQPAGGTYYQSQKLDDLWGLGYVKLDIVSPAACRYVAGHNAGKLNIEKRRPDGGSSAYYIPAKRPAIGMAFAREFYRDITGAKAALVGNNLTGVPRSYLRAEPELFQSVIEHNRQYAIDNPATVIQRVSESERMDEMHKMLISQAAEAKAWHKGCH